MARGAGPEPDQARLRTWVWKLGLAMRSLQARCAPSAGGRPWPVYCSSSQWLSPSSSSNRVARQRAAAGAGLARREA